MSLERKLKRKSEVEQKKYIADVKGEAKKIAGMALDKATTAAYNEGYQDALQYAANEAFAKVAAVTAEILYNHWRDLTKKDTRLATYWNLLLKKAEQVNEPTEEQAEVERILYEQCGIKFER